MKLSKWAEIHSLTYRAAWDRFNKGQIEGAWQDNVGTIHVPEAEEAMLHKAAIYARVSTSSQKEDLKRQVERLTSFAISRGYESTLIVDEIASGVNDRRTELTRLLTKYNNEWGTLIVEHRDRLTRVGFEWFPTMLSAMHKEVIVVNQAEDSEEGRTADILSILYSYAASEYGRRGAKFRAERAALALEDSND